MKTAIIASILCIFATFPVFGEVSENTKSDLYSFPTVATVAKVEPKTVDAPIVAQADEKEVPAETKAENSSPIKEVTTPALVADAQTLIKDKLVQKYQVKLDEVLSRMTTRMSSVSADEQRVVLTDLRDRMVEKRAVVNTMNDLDPLKKDILISILDHVVTRLDGMIKQTAEHVTTAMQA